MSIFSPGDEEVAGKLYRAVYYSFGLPSSYKMPTHGTREVKAHWSYKSLVGFEVRGKHLTPQFFMSRGSSNVMDKIDREIQTPRGQRFAYDFSMLDRGILKARLVHEEDDAFIVSNEYREALYAIGHAIHNQMLTVPTISIDFGDIWQTHRVPEQISITMNPAAPMRKYEMERLMEQMAHRYSITQRPDIKGTGRWNLNTGQFILGFEDRSLMAAERPSQAPQSAQHPPMPQQAPQSAQRHPLLQQYPDAPAPNPDFPYDFYRSIGLIDDEGLVSVPTLLGPLRIYATSEPAHEYMLSYTPE